MCVERNLLARSLFKYDPVKPDMPVALITCPLGVTIFFPVVNAHSKKS